MKQIRIGNDIKFSLSLTGEAADAIAWHVFVKESAPEMPKGTIVLNGRKEHCHGRVIELAAVQVSSSVSGKTVTAVWTADKQMLGVWDVIVTAETASGSKGAADVRRVVEITKHTGTSAGDAAGTVTEVVSLGTLSITFSGMSAYELAVSKGYTGTVTEWLLSLKGAKGDTGATGAAGHSPVISTRKYGGVTTVYVDGTAVAEINDGAKGDTGATGQKGDAGADGLTPNITASKTGKITKIYSDGVEIAQVLDGNDGTATIVISVWSDDEPLVEAGKYMYAPTAKKLWLGYNDGAALKKKQVQMMSNMLYLYNNNIYVFDGTELVISDSSQKPADGWAKSDLNESVQASLNKADSALQTHQDISGKQDAIADLATIRSGAALGATALQPVQGKGLSTNDYTNEEKAKLSQVGAEVSQLQTTTKTKLSVDSVKDNGNIVLTDGNGNKKEYMAATPSGDPMHYLYETYGAIYNATDADINKVGEVTGDAIVHKKGMWYFNELGDLTTAEMKKIVAFNRPANISLSIGGDGAKLSIQRTFLPIQGYINPTIGITQLAAYNTKVESIRLSREGNYASFSSSAKNTFLQCKKLKKVIDGQIYMSSIATPTNIEGMFSQCYALEYIKLTSLIVSVYLGDSPNFRADCVAWAINNASTNTITITLHADAYARAMADADVQAALASKTNVTLVSA